mmetsp:Transcript_23782/g.31084  ORF Transcript_23782/g.31084 Transcript_23782/m.31084 type:complete len:1149 (-) Transcript_23782:213-3659(-)
MVNFAAADEGAETERIKGNGCFNGQDYKGAIEHYSKALKLLQQRNDSPIQAKILSNRALAFFKTRKFEECVKDCSEAISIDASFQKVWYRRGLAYQELGEFVKAASDFQQSVTLSSDGTLHGKKELEALQKYLSVNDPVEVLMTDLPNGPIQDQSRVPPVPLEVHETISCDDSDSGNFEVPAPGSLPVCSGRNVFNLTFTDSEDCQLAPHPCLSSPGKDETGLAGTGTDTIMKPPHHGNGQQSKTTSLVSLPSRHRQFVDIHRLLAQADKKPLEEGDVWYVIHYKWMEKWRQYVKYEELVKKQKKNEQTGDMDSDKMNEDEEDYSIRQRPSTDELYVEIEGNDGEGTKGDSDNNSVPRPPPIDNSGLVLPNEREALSESPKLQLRLVQGYHYELIPQEAWEALHQWYGGGPVIARVAVNTLTEEGQNKNISVQLYPELAQLQEEPTPMDEDSDTPPSTSYSPLPNSALGAGEDEPKSAGKELQQRCEACARPGKSACSKCKQVRYCGRQCQQAHWAHHKLVCRPWVPPADNPQAKPKALPLSAQPRRGKTGLSNLGNTCFMNSGLQCLSHAFPLTRHFLSNAWKDDINYDNPLGTGGNLAKAYDELVKELWFGSRSYTSPTKMKYQISKFAPQFSGFAQHDAQELLVYLLDGLHEDLNRVKKKPYVEMPDGGDGRPDDVVSAEAWEKYMSRNQSVVIEHFCGLFKSTLICPVCNKISIVFDPYNVVALELPSRHERVVEVVFVLRDGSVPTRYAIRLDASCTMADVKEKLAKMVGFEQSHLLLAEVYNNNIYQIFKDQFPLSKLRDEDIVIAYEILPMGKEYGHAVLLHRWLDEDEGGKPELFGIPVIISFHTSWTTWDLRKHVWQQLKRLLDFDIKKIESDPKLWQDLLKSLQLCEVSQNGLRYKSQAKDSEDAESKESKFADYITNLGKYFPKDDKYLCQEFLDIRPFALSFLAVDWKDLWQTHMDREEVKMCYDDDSMTEAYEESNTATTLQHCFDKFTKPEKLDKDNPWYCSKCQDFRQATKTLQLWRIPDILILVLKRFEFRNVLYRDKLEAYIDFPINGLDMSSFCLGESSDVPAIYDLFAVSNHMGRMGFGHYTAYARDWTDKGLGDQWYLFDDSHVTEVSENVVKSKSAYILFYRRRNFY